MHCFLNGLEGPCTRGDARLLGGLSGLSIVAPTLTEGASILILESALQDCGLSSRCPSADMVLSGSGSGHKWGKVSQHSRHADGLQTIAGRVHAYPGRGTERGAASSCRLA